MIVDFRQAADPFSLGFTDAINHFSHKSTAKTWHWSEMLAEEHDNAFTVAKMMNDDLLATVKDALDDTLANGKTLKDFKDELIPVLQKKGWWGKKTINAGTMLEETVQLGSPSRLENIFRTNLQSSYQAGHWQSIQQSKIAMPFLMYDAVDDGRARPEHAAHDGIVLSVDDPFWDLYYPLNGWQCRCGVIQMSADDLDDYGLNVSPPQKVKLRKWKNPATGKTQMIPDGIDPGFAHNVGKNRASKLKEIQAQKLAKFKGAYQKMVGKGNEATLKAAEAAKETLKQLGIDSVKGAADKAKARAVEKSAQWQLDHALEANTPYLAPAIKAVKKTKAADGMSAQDLLKAAQDKAGKKQVSDQLAKYKKAKVEGKTPNANAQGAFDALPDEAQSAILTEIDVKTGNAQAKIDLDKIAAGTADKQASIKKQLYTKLQKDGHDFPDAKSLLAHIDAEAQIKADLKQKNKHLAGYKKKVLADQAPTPAQAKVFNDLTDAEQSALLAEIDELKGPKNPVIDDVKPVINADDAPAFDLDRMVQTGGQGGSNPGGTYHDPLTGKNYYVKFMGNQDQAKNEVLAAKLYKAAGIEVPEVNYFEQNGTFNIASEIIDGLGSDKQALINGAEGVAEGFAVDAWLANWDVIGLTYDNLLLKGGRAIRVDTGGALEFRAQGGKKGALFGDKVTEIDSLRDSSMNPQAASVFGKLTDNEISTSAGKLAKISDKQIADLVNDFGQGDSASKKALAKRLIARRDDILARFPGMTKAAQKAKQDAIAAEKSTAALQLADLDDSIITAVKGIAMRQKNGSPLEAKDADRVKTAKENLEKLLNGKAYTDKFKYEVGAHYQDWIEQLNGAINDNQALSGGFFKGMDRDRIGIDDSKVKFVIPDPNQKTKPMMNNAQATEVIKTYAGDYEAKAGVQTNGPASYQKAYERLTESHKRAISMYTGSHYSRLNTSLYTRSADAKTQAFKELLNQALENSDPFVGTSTRGMTLDRTALNRWITEHKRAMLEGKPVSYLSFISSTKGSSAAFGGNVRIVYSGKKGVWVNPISRHAGRENEVLFKADSSFMVDKVVEDQDGFSLTLYLTETDEINYNTDLEFSEW